MSIFTKDGNNTLDLNQHTPQFLQANWCAPAAVRTLITTRCGGVSQGVYRSLNVGAHVGDDINAVQYNRALVQAKVPVKIIYLNQVHSSTVVSAIEGLHATLNADACVDNTGTVACAVMTADCLPVLLCNRAGTIVAAAHAGWRGLVNGILQNTIAAMGVSPEELMVWLGPAISSEAFEVGQEVFDAFCQNDISAQNAFKKVSKDKYLADIYALARQILYREGVTQVYGGNYCTVLDPDTFFSYRRDGQTGRMVSVIWLED